MLKAVIFDMDGVIINSEPIHYQCLSMITKDFGFQFNKEQYNQYVGVSAKDMWKCLKTKYNLPESVDNLVEREYALYIEYLKTNESTIKPIDGVKELIINLYQESIPLVLASSSERKNIKYILKMFDIISYFDEIVSGFEVPKSKPFPDIFLKASTLIGAEPQECIVIEDSFNGVQAAKEARMKVVGFQNIYSGNQDLSRADLIVDKISKLSPLVLRKIFTV